MHAQNNLSDSRYHSLELHLFSQEIYSLIITNDYFYAGVFGIIIYLTEESLQFLFT